jgi:hypothetical protein
VNVEDAGSSTTDGAGSGTTDDAVSNTAEVSNYKNIYTMYYINSIISKCDQSTVKFIDARMNIILHFALFMNKSLILMVNNSTNINNENNQFSIEDKKKTHNIWRYKSRFQLGTGKQMWPGQTG